MAPYDRVSKKRLTYIGSVSEEDNARCFAEDEEADETFLALQKLLQALNRSSRSSHGSFNSNNGSFLGGGGNSAQTAPVCDTASQQRLSRDEMLETRRQERDRVRRSLFAKNGSSCRSRRRHTLPGCYVSEEDEDEEVSVPSVESTISNRFMNGSFSALNVHVISRDRWSTEDHVMERLPIVIQPKNGKHSTPTDNEKINVVHTDEFIELRESLVKNMSDEASTAHYLSPPRSTWYMQMHGFEELNCS
ncbi:uncharacterized protein CCR75_002135 [Bremia lactucae]|uniref:Uncharacterized protein n=1 Tax=Bremia lactucae TaxID=4779 RepID=A0A976FDG9_BRELC|nr:hypothetical protein CCR75_002135 [Bremia lactucae]